MPLDTAGNILYRDATDATGIRFQADPPVCNICQRQITRQNFGFTCLESGARLLETFEFVECTACTVLRVGGGQLVHFLKRHRL